MKLRKIKPRRQDVSDKVLELVRACPSISQRQLINRMGNPHHEIKAALVFLVFRGKIRIDEESFEYPPLRYTASYTPPPNNLPEQYQ